MTDATIPSPEPSRRIFMGHIMAGALVSAVGVPVITAADAVAAYQSHMNSLAAIGDCDDEAVAADWNDQEESLIEQMAETPGDLADLLRKVVIMTDRAEDQCWNLMDAERELLASMREQAEGFLRLG